MKKHVLEYGSRFAQLTLFHVIKMWLMANDYAPTITISENPAWLIIANILMPIWSTFHFYWAHRLLHSPFFLHTASQVTPP